MRKLQHLRPYICPFEILLQYVPDGAHVLDIGCGGGLFLGLVVTARRRAAGVGFDVSQPAIQVAQQMSQRALANGNDQTLTFRQIATFEDWPTGVFDVVSAIDVAHHIPPQDQRKFIEAAASRVKPGGILLYKDVCRRPSWRAAANRLHDLVLARQWIHELDPEHVQSWVGALGFELIHAERINRYWYGHDLRVFRLLP